MNRSESNKIAKAFLTTIKSNDFVSFCNFVRIKNIKDQSLLTFSQSSWNWEQKQFYSEFQKGLTKKARAWDLVIKPRRIGMSTFGCVQDYFFALANPGRSVLIIAQSDDVSNEMFEIIKGIHETLESLGKSIGRRLVPTFDKNNRKEIKFSNGSRIMIEVAKATLSAAKRTARGKTISRLHCTEVAFWSYPSETMLSVLEAASKAQEILIESTANGAQGWFYEQIQNKDKSPYQVHFFPWYKSTNCELEPGKNFDCSPQNNWEKILISTHKITPAQLNWWRSKIETHGIDNVLQEYPIDLVSCFRTKTSSFIGPDDDLWLMTNIREPFEIREVDGVPISVWEFPTGENYIMGVDCGYGTGGDNSVFYIINSSGNIVCSGVSSELRPSQFAAVAMDLATQYNMALIVVEKQGPGQSAVDYLQDAGYPNLFKHDDKDYYGWNTNNVSRTRMFYHISNYIQTKASPIPDIGLVSELRTLVINKHALGERPEARKGNTDDRVLAFGIAISVWHSMPQITNIRYQSVEKADVRKDIFGQSLGRGRGFV